MICVISLCERKIKLDAKSDGLKQTVGKILQEIRDVSGPLILLRSTSQAVPNLEK